MNLIKLFISATRKGGLGWSTTEVKRCQGELGGGRLSVFNPDIKPLWFFLDDQDLDADDMPVLIERGYETILVDEQTGAYYTQAKLDKSKAKYQIVTPHKTSVVKPESDSAFA